MNLICWTSFSLLSENFSKFKIYNHSRHSMYCLTFSTYPLFITNIIFKLSWTSTFYPLCLQYSRISQLFRNKCVLSFVKNHLALPYEEKAIGNEKRRDWKLKKLTLTRKIILAITSFISCEIEDNWILRSGYK